MPITFNFDFFCTVIAVVALASSVILLLRPTKSLHWRTYAVIANAVSLYMVVLMLNFGESEPRGLTLLLSLIGMQMLALVPMAKRPV